MQLWRKHFSVDDGMDSKINGMLFKIPFICIFTKKKISLDAVLPSVPIRDDRTQLVKTKRMPMTTFSVLYLMSRLSEQITLEQRQIDVVENSFE